MSLLKAWDRIIRNLKITWWSPKKESDEKWDTNLDLETFFSQLWTCFPFVCSWKSLQQTINWKHLFPIDNSSPKTKFLVVPPMTYWREDKEKDGWKFMLWNSCSPGESQPHKSAHVNVYQSVNIEEAENILHKITPSAQKNMCYTS
jgi:hypothetical protein